MIPPNPSGKLTVSIQKLDAASFNRNPVRFCPDPFVFVPRRPHPQRRVRATTARGSTPKRRLNAAEKWLELP